MERIKFNANGYPLNEIIGGNFMQPRFIPNQIANSKTQHSQFSPQYSEVQFNSMHGHYPRQMNASVSKNYPSMPQSPISSKPTVGANGCLSGAPSNHPSVAGNNPILNPNNHFQPHSPSLSSPVSSSGNMPIQNLNHQFQPNLPTNVPPVSSPGNMSIQNLNRHFQPHPPTNVPPASSPGNMSIQNLNNYFQPRPPTRVPPVSSPGNRPIQNLNQQFRPHLPTFAPPVSSPARLQTPGNSTVSKHRPLFNTPPPSVIPAGKIDPMQFEQLKFPPPPIPPSTSNFSHENVKSASFLPNNHSQQHINNTSVQTVFPSGPNLVPSQSTNLQPSTMSQIISNIQLTSKVPKSKSIVSEKESLLNNFLQKLNFKEKHEAKKDITVAGFRSSLKKCFSLFNLLQSSRKHLVSLLDSNQEEWEIELKHAKDLQKKLSEAYSELSLPNNLTIVQKKLKTIKKKRALKKKLRATVLEQKVKKDEERKRLHQEIDKWLYNLKEKNEKLKREIEMKKEADNILSEVRRKIHEAKKTLEKLKVFEKLRSVRQTNAGQKGLYLQPGHLARFDTNLSHLREVMLLQLSNYEQEEKALQVMLETEQEDRREEEALWRKRKLMTFQQKKQKAIMECLFGDSDEPSADDPLFLFYQYQNFGNKDIDNLVQIRQHWDAHLDEKGESIPSQWVVPLPPNSSSWEGYCTS